MINMNTAEVEFIAGNELISIVPNFSHNICHMICGDIGPFQAGIPLRVPLWMCINLKQRQKCKVVPPEWLTTEKLEEVKENEEASPFFTKIENENAVTVGQILLNIASDDIPRSTEIKILMKDILDLRAAKLKSSVNSFIQSGGIHAKLDHLSNFEMCRIRHILTRALNESHKLSENTSFGLQDTLD